MLPGYPLRCILKWLKSCDAPSCPTCKAPVIVPAAPNHAAPQHGQSATLGSAAARPLRLLGARLATPT